MAEYAEAFAIDDDDGARTRAISAGGNLVRTPRGARAESPNVTWQS